MATYLFLLVLPGVIGVVGGRLLGGSLRNVGDARLRAMWLIWLAAVVQLAQLMTGAPLLFVAFTLVSGWIGVNVLARPRSQQFGLGTLSVGLLGNGVAIAANGRMPYSMDAAVRVGLTPTLTTPKNSPAELDTVLPWLGDVIPVAPLRAVISIGDIGIAIGVAVLVAAIMQNQSRTPIVSRR